MGVVSVLLILYRIVNPPDLGWSSTWPSFTEEASVQFPIFLALLAAAGIALGGFWAMREEGTRKRATDP